MKILCVIDALGPGGAERQMTGLSTMLKAEGHEVIVRYHEPKHFFTEQIQKAGIDVECLGAGKSRFQKVILYRKEIKRLKPDVVISYLQPSNILTSIIRFSGLKFKLIVSERNTNTGKGLRDYVRFNLYRIADYVIPNSYSQEKFIKENFSFLSSKTQAIVNFVDTDFFKPVEKDRGNEILVAATIWPSKNTLGFIEAVKLLKDKGAKFHVSWFGKVPDMMEYISKCEDHIAKLGVGDYITLLDKTPRIHEEYVKADYFCLPSFYEGTPNVICEAMASGLPIICSDVCDNGRYVEDGVNGILFNPHDVNTITESIQRILAIDNDAYLVYKGNSRNKALTMLAKQVFINKYLELL